MEAVLTQLMNEWLNRLIHKLIHLVRKSFNENFSLKKEIKCKLIEYVNI